MHDCFGAVSAAVLCVTADVCLLSIMRCSVLRAVRVMVASTVLGVLLYLIRGSPSTHSSTCAARMCPSGQIVAQSGLGIDSVQSTRTLLSRCCGGTEGPCDGLCSGGGELLLTSVLWNAPVHSWTGVAEEAVDFLVPLAAKVPHLALTGAALV